MFVPVPLHAHIAFFSVASLILYAFPVRPRGVLFRLIPERLAQAPLLQ